MRSINANTQNTVTESVKRLQQGHNNKHVLRGSNLEVGGPLECGGGGPDGSGAAQHLLQHGLEPHVDGRQVHERQPRDTRLVTHTARRQHAGPTTSSSILIAHWTAQRLPCARLGGTVQQHTKPRHIGSNRKTSRESLTACLVVRHAASWRHEGPLGQQLIRNAACIRACRINIKHLTKTSLCSLD